MISYDLPIDMSIFHGKFLQQRQGRANPERTRRLSHVDAIAFVHGGLRSAQLRGLRKAAEEAVLPWPIYGSYDVIFLLYNDLYNDL